MKYYSNAYKRLMIKCLSSFFMKVHIKFEAAEEESANHIHESLIEEDVESKLNVNKDGTIEIHYEL